MKHLKQGWSHGAWAKRLGLKTTSSITKIVQGQRYHEQMLDNARASIRSVDVDRRELTGSSLVLRCENLAQAKEMIREFKKKFAQTFEEENGDAVYQIQIQLFPLTKKASPQ